VADWPVPFPMRLASGSALDSGVTLVHPGAAVSGDVPTIRWSDPRVFAGTVTRLTRAL
jgi:hypothetical protein